ncbi:MAG: AEC family transporter [Firmicutes bacterium]|nr:AEC family transporter [Bacillota bacterium]
MLTVLIKILGIFAIIVVGFIATKSKVITKEAEPALVNLLLIITTPCMIFSSIVTRELDTSISGKIAIVIFGSLAYFIIMPIIIIPLSKRIFTHTPKEDLGILMAIMVANNTGFMGFPITRSVFGEHYFFLIVIQNIVLNIYLFLIAVMQMNYGNRSSFDIKHILKSIFSPCIVAAIGSMVILFSKIKMPETLLDITGMLGNVTTPLSMIVVGMRLANSNFKSVIKNRDLIIASVFNVILVPLITFLLVHWLPLSNDVKLIFIWAATFPCAVIIAGIASKEGRNATLASEGIALTTLMSLITLPIAASILSAIYL